VPAPTLSTLARRLAARTPELTDAELLDRFRTAADEAAFETLVRRHGPLVLAACRRVLSDEADVEDAFQATFLVLVRSARSVRREGSVGSWLFGVARRVALRVRSAARRPSHDPRPARQESPPDLTWQEACDVLATPNSTASRRATAGRCGCATSRAAPATRSPPCSGGRPGR
jgi:DNA-directed RNA polymerase specialized sigma24 family protein